MDVRSKICLVGSLLVGLVACAERSNTGAIAYLEPTAGNTVKGIVDFALEDGGIRVEANLDGLGTGLHGLHIHANGECASADAAAGELGNVQANAAGVARTTLFDPELELEGPSGILDRAIVVHAETDDATSSLACGVIRRVPD